MEQSVQDPLKRIAPVAWVGAAVIVAMLLVVFRAPLEWMLDRWMKPDSYYSHGFLVPPVALWLAWRDRHELARLKNGRWGLGLGVMLVGLFILLASGIFVVYFTSIFGLILAVWGLCGFLFGTRVMARLAFPAFVLTFMAPLPLAMIADISLTLKLMATRAALLLLNVIGILSINDGSTIYLGDVSVTVGNACSGLRSLISLIFLGVLFAYLTPLAFWKQVVLFLCSVPIALAANVVRVFILCLLAYNYGEEFIIGTVHDMSGYLIFVVAFILLYLASRLLAWGRKPAGTSPSQVPAAAPKEAQDE